MAEEHSPSGSSARFMPASPANISEWIDAWALRPTTGPQRRARAPVGQIFALSCQRWVLALVNGVHLRTTTQGLVKRHEAIALLQLILR